MDSMKFVIPLHFISWKKTSVTPQCQCQFTSKMKANAVPRLLSSLMWIDSGVVVSEHRLESCNGMTSFMEFTMLMLRIMISASYDVSWGEVATWSDANIIFFTRRWCLWGVAKFMYFFVFVCLFVFMFFFSFLFLLFIFHIVFFFSEGDKSDI